jgi:hypothetical protein
LVQQGLVPCARGVVLVERCLHVNRDLIESFGM